MQTLRFSTASTRTLRFLTRVLAAASILACAALLIPHSTQAQHADGSLGIGGQIGEPSGLTLEFYSQRGFSYDFLAAWDLDDFLYINGHATRRRSFNNNARAHLFYGPGAFVGVRDRGDDDDVAFGISGTVGIGLPYEQFTFYVRLTPRLEVIPETDGDIGGGIGVRYYF